MPSTTIRRSSHLPASPDAVWRAVKRPQTFATVVRPLFFMPALKRYGDDIAQPGLEGTGFVWLFGIVPLERRTIRIVAVDETARRMETAERAGVIRSWTHVLLVEPDGEGTRYTDEVTFDAGPLTGALRPVIAGLFAYRHRRWARKLPILLSSN